MLSWDEETASRASAQPRPHLQAVPSVPQFSTHADAPLNPGILARSEPPVDTAQRVQAADKRIINGQTDVNQLVPF
jgi:ribonucleoside-diphosphate reductase beta chain